ncbi:MAG: hypothetical protein J5616_06415 [Bacteroidaceae bacterium]|nr:hypothetical protein [Bacteroidaceae bacterium]
MKKKTMLIVAASLMLTTSCTFSGKTEITENVDSVEANALVDTPEARTADEPQMQADGVDVAPADQWTEDAVAQQLKKIYAEVSKVYAPSKDGMENNTDLDAMFCTKDFNEVQCQVRAINAKKSSGKRFERDDIRWTYGMDVPVTPKNIKVDLLTGNTAEATFELSSGEQWMYTKLTLDWEDGQWKIRSWNVVGDDNSDLLDEMYKYVSAN